jgi:hypothetical protein
VERKEQSLPLSSVNITSEVVPVLALNEVSQFSVLLPNGHVLIFSLIFHRQNSCVYSPCQYNWIDPYSSSSVAHHVNNLFCCSVLMTFSNYVHIKYCTIILL